MSLELNIVQRVACSDVVAIARQACEAILRVYNSEARAIELAAASTARNRCAAARRRSSLRLPAAHVWLSSVPPPQAESWDVERKADDSPLTRADREANAVICEGLARIGARRLGSRMRPFGWVLG